MKNYRKYLKELKEYRRKKFPYIKRFLIGLIVKEFQKEVKPLLERFVKTYKSTKKITQNYPKKRKKSLTKNPRGKIEKRQFFCLKHNTFHKHRFQGNPSKTYQKCLNSDNFYKFKENIENYELFNISFKKVWKRESNRQKKESYITDDL